MPILHEERSAAMIAVRDEIVAQAPPEIRDEVRRYLTDARVLAISNAANKPFISTINRLEDELKGLA